MSEETFVFVPGAFEPTAFTSAFQLARVYAAKKRRSRGGRPGQSYLVPYGPIYSDEKLVIVRTKIANAEKWTEKHYEYKSSEDQPVRVAAKIGDSVSFRIAENWLNKQEPLTVKARRIEYAED
jgi:hypothetical protein